MTDVASAVDRLSQGYEPDFDIDYAVGHQGELFVTSIIDAFKADRVETKTDAMIAKTGNVYIEYECLKRGKYVPSGIAVTKAELWAFVLPANVLIVAPVSSVLELSRRHYRAFPKSRVGCSRGDHPTKGVVIPVGRFVAELYRFEAVVSTAAAPP